MDSDLMRWVKAQADDPNANPRFRELLDALEAAQMGLRYVVRVWVLSDEIVWSEEKIDEVVESIICDAKKEAGRG